MGGDYYEFCIPMYLCRKQSDELYAGNRVVLITAAQTGRQAGRVLRIYIISLWEINQVGPYAVVTDETGVQPGDIVQLGSKEKGFYHSPVIVAVRGGQFMWRPIALMHI